MSKNQVSQQVLASRKQEAQALLLELRQGRLLGRQEAGERLPLPPLATKDRSIESLLKLCHLQVLMRFFYAGNDAFPAIGGSDLLNTQMSKNSRKSGAIRYGIQDSLPMRLSGKRS